MSPIDHATTTGNGGIPQMKPRNISVFLASPGDVAGERTAAAEVLDRLPDEPAFRGKIAIQTIAWDQHGGVPQLATLSPQDAILRNLPRPSQCDIVVVILWSRMGTPLPASFKKDDGQPYLSGTEWEYHDAVRGAAARDDQRPIVLLYRCTKPVCFSPADRDFNEKFAQFTSVKQFFDRCRGADGSITTGVNQYTDAADFPAQLHHHLQVEIVRLLDQQPKPAEQRLTLNHNLPPRSYGTLIGRTVDLGAVIQGLRSAKPLTAISGFPGMGKTSLATEIGYLCLGKSDLQRVPRASFEYVAWFSANDRPCREDCLNQLIDIVARVVGFLSITQQGVDQLDEKKRRLTDFLREKRVLIIIDNFEAVHGEAELLNWLRQVPEPSKVLLTTRMRQVEDASMVRLPGLKDEAALQFVRQHGRLLDLDHIERVGDEQLTPLVRATAGNPRAMGMVLGQVAAGNTLDAVVAKLAVHGPASRGTMNPIFEGLYGDAWKLISDQAQVLLSSVPLFAGAELIGRPALLAVSGLTEPEFDAAVAQVINFYLLDFNYAANRYTVPPMTAAFAARKLETRPAFRDEARCRLANHYLEFVRRHARREKPGEAYWNALVSESMVELDPEWPMIRQVMLDAARDGDDGLVLELVLLLVHYMDSRFYHLDRVEFVNKAIAAATRLNRPADAALLHIDALGWTYVEQLDLEKAKAEVETGLALARRLPPHSAARDELRALGLTWQARVALLEDRVADADHLITRALRVDCKPVIRFRINMIAGDVKLQLKRAADAQNLYNAAITCSNEYGGEGGYQTLPRFGLAYLEMGEFDAAERQFHQLAACQGETAKLYAQYGEALVTYRRGRKSDALRLAQETRARLLRLVPVRSTSQADASAGDAMKVTGTHILLKLLDRMLAEVGDRSAATVPATAPAPPTPTATPQPQPQPQPRRPARGNGANNRPAVKIAKGKPTSASRPRPRPRRRRVPRDPNMVPKATAPTAAGATASPSPSALPRAASRRQSTH